ncbi:MULTISPECIES: LysE family translocator [Pseudomonas]|jgi:threonine/homoserine/homoserine lactone efflux protein|uniref:LysE family translocator n=1 Tax=Pseudomonas TaxID=286 RepID=UPI00193F1CFC|nr:LysE family translocator [Pseudomonas arcuscaelestis]MBM3104559.1 LysE family translocator [Pseudomonas arcuscaelestis]
MNTALLLTYALSVLLLIATPGPVVALVVNTAANAGRRQALMTALGTNGASLVLIALAASLILTSATIAPHLLAALSLAGCLFIGYLAIASLRQALGQQGDDAPAPPRAQGGLWRGFATGLSNPKDILFFVALFPQFIHITSHTGNSLLLLSLVWIVLDMAILGLYILLTSTLATPRQQRLISLTSGGVLLVIAVTGLFYNLCSLWR